MQQDDQDVQEGWQILVSLVDKVIPGLIPEHGYPENVDTSGREPTNTNSEIRIPEPVPESLLFQEEEVSLEKLLQHCVTDVVNTTCNFLFEQCTLDIEPDDPCQHLFSFMCYRSR